MTAQHFSISGTTIFKSQGRINLDEEMQINKEIEDYDLKDYNENDLEIMKK